MWFLPRCRPDHGSAGCPSRQNGSVQLLGRPGIEGGNQGVLVSSIPVVRYASQYERVEDQAKEGGKKAEFG